MSRFYNVLFSLFIVMSFVACSSSDNKDGSTSGSIPSETVIQGSESNSSDQSTDNNVTDTNTSNENTANPEVPLDRNITDVNSSEINTELNTSETSAKEKVLLLYDDAGEFGHIGVTNAILLENLLGHFDEVSVTSKPASQYIAHEMNDTKAVFYLGTTYNVLSNYVEGSTETLAYQNFFRDVAASGKNVVWMNYNLELLEEFWKNEKLNNTILAQQHGISFKTITQGNYNRIEYKDTELFKGVVPFATPGSDVSLCLEEGNNSYACSLEVVEINIVDTNKTTVMATTYSTLHAETAETPYITKAGKFWFVGDIPFTYMSEEDRYLAFADLLYDMLEIHYEESYKAIMRLEDVDARTDLTALTDIANYMQSKKIPFSVATIAQYEDPLGIENNGVATTELITSSAVGVLLKQLYDAGAIHIIQHGTTHQYHTSITDPASEINNPYNGVSGNDFEFMRVIEIDPLEPYLYLYPTMNDSSALARERTVYGKNILSDLGVEPFAWEAPHYMAGPNQYRAINEIYPVQYSRMLYYPFEQSSDSSKKYQFIGQFFPYVIKKDIYGATIIPENIHNVEDAPNIGYRPLTPSDVIRFAKKLKVVRGAVASFYYHPHLGSSYLREIVEGLEAEGYQFVSAPSLLPTK